MNPRNNARFAWIGVVVAVTAPLVAPASSRAAASQAPDPILTASVQSVEQASQTLNEAPTDPCIRNKALTDSTEDKKQINLLLQARTEKMKRKVITVSPGSCEKINEAARKLPKGGTIRLLPGDYECTDPVIIDRDDIALIGAGRDATKLRSKDGRSIPVLVIGDVINGDIENGIPYPTKTTHNIVLGGLSIDGNLKSANLDGIDSKHFHLECYDPGTKESQICAKDNGHFIRNNGLTVRRTENILVRNLDSSDNYSGGITIEKKNKDVVMDDFSASGNFFDGFAGYETDGGHFTHFKLHGNMYSGISVDCFFVNNDFGYGSVYENGDDGVYAKDVGNNHFHNMKVYNNRNSNFIFDGWSKDNVKVLGTCDQNEIRDTEISGGNSGIRFNFPCQGTEISRVTISKPAWNCFGTVPGAHWNEHDVNCIEGN